MRLRDLSSAWTIHARTPIERESAAVPGMETIGDILSTDDGTMQCAQCVNGLRQRRLLSERLVLLANIGALGCELVGGRHGMLTV